MLFRSKTMKPRLAEIFRTRTRDEWCELLEGTDACFAPVLPLSEAPYHPHNIARQAFVDVNGQMQNAPAPRYSRTPAGPPRESQHGPEAVTALLRRWGCDSTAIQKVIGC